MPELSISPNPIAGPEGSAGVSFVLRLSDAAAQDVTATLLYRNGTANSADADFDRFAAVRTKLDVVIPAGSREQTVTLYPGSDREVEQDENYVVEVINPANATFAGGAETLRVTGIIEDTGLSLFVSDPILQENDGGTQQAIFEIRLSRPASESITLDYRTVDGKAQAGEDYRATDGQVTFAAGETVKLVRVDVLGDTAAEISEDFALVVTPDSGSGAEILRPEADAIGQALILDDDAEASLPVLTMEGVTGRESQQAETMLLRLSEPSANDVTLSLRIVADSADKADVDFNSGAAVTTELRVTIPAGDTVLPVSLYHGNDAAEADESYTVEAFNLDGAVLSGEGLSQQVTNVIEGDGLSLFVGDPVMVEGDRGTTEAVFEVRLSRPSDAAIALDYETVDGTAHAGEDYRDATGTLSFAPGETVKYVRVDVQGDRVAEISETFSLLVTPQASSAARFDAVEADNVGRALILDDDTSTGLPVLSVEGVSSSESQQGEAVVLRLSEPSRSDVTAKLRILSDLADSSDVDFNSGSAVTTEVEVVIPAGQTMATTFVYHGFGAAEADENYRVELFDVAGAALSGDVASQEATSVILDDGRSLFVGDPTMVEGDDGEGLARFEVRLSRPAAEVMVFDFTTLEGTAEAGSDFDARSGSLKFRPGETVKYVDVTVFGDRMAEQDETFSLRLDARPRADDLLADATADNVGVATIRNDDRALPVVEGTNGPDSLPGSAVAEWLRGYAGDDRLEGAGGDDELHGDAGDDTLAGGEGADYLLGGDGFDFADYSASGGRVIVNLRNESYRGGDADGDGGTGIEGVIGSDFGDLLSGSDRADAHLGGAGRDRLVGRDGDDTLEGGADNDKLRGKGGDDVLVGGAKRDKMWGDEGADTFVFGRGDGVDRVKDFDIAEDTLLLAEDLLGGLVEPEDIVEEFGSLTASGALLKLEGARIKLDGIDDLDALATAIEPDMM